MPLSINDLLAVARLADGKNYKAALAEVEAILTLANLLGDLPEARITNLVGDLGALSAAVLARALAALTLTANAPITGGGDLTLNRVFGFDQTADLGNNARVTVRKNTGVNVGTRRRVNLIEGANITLTINDDAIAEEVDITIDGVAAAPPAPSLLRNFILMGA